MIKCYNEIKTDSDEFAGKSNTGVSLVHWGENYSDVARLSRTSLRSLYHTISYTALSERIFLRYSFWILDNIVQRDDKAEAKATTNTHQEKWGQWHTRT